jgi:uncharacterized protein (TIGR03083 family)
MTTAAIDALRADRAAITAIVETLDADDWAAPSGCDGWAVRDVIAHMAQLFRQVVEPASLPPGDPSGSTERTQDRWVEAMRPVPVEQVVADYVKLGDQATDRLAALQGNDNTIDLGDLGTHPLHLVANAFAFDHYAHLRLDLVAPRGPLAREAPPADERHLGAVVDWMVAGMPQMCTPALAELHTRVTLEITGPGGRTISVDPTTEGGITVLQRATETSVATIVTASTDLVAWGTRRRNWRELDVVIRGDTGVGERFCDAVHVF